MNTQVRWLRIKQLFRETQLHPESEREAWLVAQCAGDHELLLEVRGLLSAQSAKPGILDDGAMEVLKRLQGSNPRIDLSGQRIGSYRLLRLIGEGGMGSVYLARREDGDFVQQVALKLVRTDFISTEVRARFLRERNFLARLVHPHIAQLHDGGVTSDGTPFFTLEYVEGEPITRYCDAHKLDIRQRISLILQVCAAVDHAHRNLIVHRDLKPSNILVTGDGETKLLDFGIAKLLDTESDESQTATQSRLMTPEYAAPEQVLGEPITTATDVYAIGVLVYELLSGRLPYPRADAGAISWAKAVVEEAPESFSRALSRSTGNTQRPTGEVAATTRATTLPSLRRVLRGDLDRIVQHALAKEPQARYSSVSALADDLMAFNEGRAISGGNRRYRLHKFLRRHWLPLGAAALLFGVIVTGALVVAMEDRQIEREAQTTAAVKDFLLGLFRNADPSVAKGKVLTVREIVDRGVQRLDTVPPEQTVLKAELQNTLGTIYYQLGYPKDAAVLHAQAFESVKSLPQETLLAATAERFQATELASIGENDQAQHLADDAIQRIRSLPHPPIHDLARALSTAGWIAKKRSDYTRAKQLGDEAFVLAQQNPANDELMFMALSQKAQAAAITHEDAAAIDDYAKALPLSIKLFGRDDQETVNTEQMLGTELNIVGRFDEAQPHLQASVDSARRIYGETDTHALRTEDMLAINEGQGGHSKESAARFARLLSTAQAHVPVDEEVLMEIRLGYAEMIVDLGQIDLAESLLLATRDFLRGHAGSAPQELAEAVSDLGYVHMLTGKLDIAESEQREALSILSAAKEDDIGSVLSRLSDTLRRGGDTQQAIELGQQARDNAIKVSGERSLTTADAHYRYALALLATQQVQQAETELRAAMKSYALLLPPDGLHPLSADARLALGNLLVARAADRAEGQHLLQQAVTLDEQVLDAGDPRTKQAREALQKAQASAKP